MTFAEFCHDHGVIAPSIIEPGRWLRVPTIAHPRKKNGVVKMADDGRVGWVRDHATMEAPALWRANGSGPGHIQRIDPREIESRRLERARIVQSAIKGAAAFWGTCHLLAGPTKYLEEKNLGVDGCTGVRESPAGELVVPMLIEGRLSSVQRISPDGSKRFWPDAPTKGAIFKLARWQSTVTIIAEGFATAATIFAAIEDASVIVTFSASNMVHVASLIQPRGLVCVAADNDEETAAKIGKNPGVEAATRAAEILGAGVAIPDCDGTDWNDLFRQRMRHMQVDSMLSKWKRRPELMRRSALAEVKNAIMRHAKFVPHPR